MADNPISLLNPLAVASAGDLFAIVDVSVIPEPETKRITVSNLMGSPGSIGTANPDSAVFTTLQLQGGVLINNISQNVNLGTSNTTVSTQGAVKAYVDSKIVAGDNVRRIDSDSTAVASDIVIVDTTNGNVTVELLDFDGRIAVKKISDDSNQVIVVASTGTIDGQAQFIITTQYQAYNFLIDSSEYFVI